ncbi:DsrE family protein [Crenothrix sp.]|uniref:DsrE family protein n=1 Tax=Crenothrix sp. TaxID=3100433 RepID=UPI00374DC211
MKSKSDKNKNDIDKRVIGFALIFIMLSGYSQMVSSATNAKQTPPQQGIQGYGKVYPYPGAAMQPSPERDYQVLFDITKTADAPDKVNPGLDHVARLLNLFAAAGVSTDRLKIVVVVHGPATPVVLKDDAYQKLYQKGNPNSELIGLLHSANVKLYICGQALAEKDLSPESVNPKVTLALSALTVLINYQLDGYALIPN